MIVSPEECELCIALIRNLSDAPTHLLTYAAPVTRKMLPLNDLRYYAIPQLPSPWKAPIWLKIELGIFAGRLYFEWEEYSNLLQYLGTSDKVEIGDLEEEPNDVRDVVEDLGSLELQEAFSGKPLAFLHEWLSIRRKGQDFEHTPLGHIVQGKKLSVAHTFFRATTDHSNAQKQVAMNSRLVQDMKSKQENEDDSDEGEDYVDDDYDAVERFDARNVDEVEATVFDEADVGGAFLDGSDYVEGDNT
jgi:hypothetical protein